MDISTNVKIAIGKCYNLVKEKTNLSDTEAKELVSGMITIILGSMPISVKRD